METKEIAMLRQEVAQLRARIDDLTKALEIIREWSIEANRDTYKTCYEAIAELTDYLWPVIHKVFPQYAETKDQLDAILKRRKPIDGEEKRP